MGDRELARRASLAGVQRRLSVAHAPAAEIPATPASMAEKAGGEALAQAERVLTGFKNFMAKAVVGNVMDSMKGVNTSRRSLFNRSNSDGNLTLDDVIITNNRLSQH